MIRFQEANLIRFGKFSDFSISFSDGLQMIYGKNEAGKSTLQLFFKVMLYGISGSKKDNKGLKLRERIIPWEDKCAEGVLRVDIDGRMVEIRRKFGKTAAGDKTDVVDFHTGESVQSIDSKNIGESLLGIPESVFEKTFWIQQGCVAFSGADEEVNNRLMNLLETGAEDVSVDKVLKLFDEEKKAIKAKDKRSNPGELDRLWELREEKMQEKYRVLSERKQRDAEESLLRQERRALEELTQQEERLNKASEQKKRMLSMETRRKKWEEAKKMLSLAQEIESSDVFQRFGLLDETLVQNAENLEKRIEVLDQNTAIEYDIKEKERLVQAKKGQRKYFNCLLGFGSLVIACSVLFMILPLGISYIISLVLCGIGILSAVVGFVNAKKVQFSIVNVDEECAKSLQQFKNLQVEKEQTEIEYKKLLSPYQCKNAGELREGFMRYKQAQIERDGYIKAYNSLLEGEDINVLSMEIESINQFLKDNAVIYDVDPDTALQGLRQKQMDTLARIKEIEGKLSYVFRDADNAGNIETEIRQINDRIDELEKRQRALEIAADVFATVSEKRKSDFTPYVNEKVNYFLGMLTNGKYQNSRVSKEYQVRIVPDNAHLYQAEFLSAGTYEQVYFSLRLALATLIGNGTEPLFLDDFLTLYDDDRAALALDLLNIISDNHQIFFFGCHGREVEYAKKCNITIHYLEEE